MLPDFITSKGKGVHRDSLAYMRESLADESVDLIFTSPAFVCSVKKDKFVQALNTKLQARLSLQFKS